MAAQGEFVLTSVKRDLPKTSNDGLRIPSPPVQPTPQNRPVDGSAHPSTGVSLRCCHGPDSRIHARSIRRRPRLSLTPAVLHTLPPRHRIPVRMKFPELPGTPVSRLSVMSMAHPRCQSSTHDRAQPFHLPSPARGNMPQIYLTTRSRHTLCFCMTVASYCAYMHCASTARGRYQSNLRNSGCEVSLGVLESPTDKCEIGAEELIGIHQGRLFRKKNRG